MNPYAKVLHEIGTEFVAPYKWLGVWRWRVSDGPHRAGDGTNKQYVWAIPTKRLQLRRGRPIKRRHKPPESLFFLPLPP